MDTSFEHIGKKVKQSILQSLNLNTIHVDDLILSLSPITSNKELWKIMDSWHHQTTHQGISFGSVYQQIILSQKSIKADMELKSLLGNRFDHWKTFMESKGVDNTSPKLPQLYMQWASIFAPDLIHLSGFMAQSIFQSQLNHLQEINKLRQRKNYFPYNTNLDRLIKSLDKSPSLSLDIHQEHQFYTISIQITSDHTSILNIEPLSLNHSKDLPNEQPWFDLKAFTISLHEPNWSKEGPLTWDEVFGNQGLLYKLKVKLIIARGFQMNIKLQIKSDQIRSSLPSPILEHIVNSIFSNFTDQSYVKVNVENQGDDLHLMSFTCNPDTYCTGSIFQKTQYLFS